MKWITRLILAMIFSASAAWGQGAEPPLTLEESIKIALQRNLTVQIANESIAASTFAQKYAFTQFFPTWTGNYNYLRSDAPGTFAGGGTTRDTYNFSTTITEPVFTGGSLSAGYRSASLGVDLSKNNAEAVKRNIILQVRQGYYNILTAQRVLEVAEQAVKQFQAQLDVTRAFFDVGIVAKNDVLQAEVRLANAIQAQVTADNNVALAKSSFNNLLRREINAPVNLVDILEYKPSGYTLESSLDEAVRQRPEIKAAQITVEQAQEAVNIAKSGYFPSINLAGNYNKLSDEANLDARWSERWTVQAIASIAFTDWWRLRYKVGQSKVQMAQAQEQKNQVIDNIILEVKQNYLNMVQAEKNISVAQKSIEQAEENVRLNEERYRYQVSTQTDVLDAVTLLAQARLNYYQALSGYLIAKASLERAMGRVYP